MPQVYKLGLSGGTRGICRKFQFLGQNPKTRYKKFNGLQTIKLSKKQICDRSYEKACNVACQALNMKGEIP
jgi:hypothetical protein